ERFETISPREAFLPPTCSRSAMPSSENQRMLCVIAAPSGWGRSPGGGAAASQGLEDQGGHLLDRLAGGVDEVDAVRVVHAAGPRQLPAGLLEGGVAGGGAALGAHGGQPLWRGQQAEAAVRDGGDRAGQDLAGEVLVHQRVVR